VTQQLQVLFLPFIACLVVTGIHVYLGIHVISRKVIFVDIALAQIAAVGATVAFLLGHDPKSEAAYYFSLGFAILAAVIFALTRTKHERVPQEAVIGLTYATASALAILLADISPHGAEHLHDLLAGSIVWVTPGQILKTFLLYLAVGAFHVVFRRRFLLISLQPQEAYARGLNVRLWDFLFYLSFGVVITSAVQIAGVLLVFCYLVAPAVFAVMFFEDLKRRLITGWAMATVVSAVGLFFSYDRPSGPTIMVCFAVALGLGGLARAVLTAPSRSRALATATAGLFLVAGIAGTLYYFRTAHSLHADEEAEGVPSRAGSPEHEIGEGIDDLRKGLRDTHENVRARAVTDLAATGDHRIVPDLVGALHDQSAAVRENAASSLMRLGDPSALPALRQGLANRDEDEWVRLQMAGAVAELGDKEGIPPLLDLARKGDAKLTRLQALTLLAKLSALPDPVPAEPDSPEGEALIRKLDAWWRKMGARLKWDASARCYREER
jgi:ABC-type Mn2+/Zn2+ transport system permease subunit